VIYLFRGNPNITVHGTPFYLANPMLLQAVCITTVVFSRSAVNIFPEGIGTQTEKKGGKV
jgi:hypothetical protein